jgi:uncharacterized protein
MSELEDFRAEKDEFFRHPQSPLTREQRATFEGLAYYAENDTLVIRETLEGDGVDLDEVIVMQTTTGGTQSYRRAGVVRFSVAGVPAHLTLFTSSDAYELFLPFRDATSGKETYGAGRYLEVEPSGSTSRSSWTSTMRTTPTAPTIPTGAVRSHRERIGSRSRSAPVRRASRVRTRSPSPDQPSARTRR